MSIIKTIFFTLSFFLFNSIYDFQVTDIDGNTINFSDFQGKNILIVNTASQSSYVNQYAELEQLYQSYKDSLVIIAIPSNSFGNETGNDSTIKSFVTVNYSIHYWLGSKMEVNGDSISPLYQWLTKRTLNNVMDNPADSDFFKYFIDKQGNLRGVFGTNISPLDSLIQNLIVSQ